MTIPPKYEDVVVKLGAALGAALGREAEVCRLYDSLVNRSNREREASEMREAALREDLESIKASVDGYDSPEHAAQVADEMGHQCDALQQRLTVAEQRAAVMEKALSRIAREHDCGCSPCTGICTSQVALEITVDAMRDIAIAALKPAEGEVS